MHPTQPTFSIWIAFLLVAAGGGIAYALGGRPRPGNERRCRWALAGMCGLYVVVFGALCLIRYEHLLCGLYDLGICDTVVWNLTRGHFLRDFRGVYDHFSPIFVLLAPFYFVWRDPRVLLLLETALLAGAAVPLYAFARTVIGDARPALVLAAAYLLHPLLSRVNLYDFHEVVFHPIAFFTLCWCYSKRRWGLTFAAAVVALCVKEDAVALVAGLGAFALVDCPRKRVGAWLIALAVAWGAAAMWVYFPLVRGEEFRHYARYPAVLGPSVGETLHNAWRAFAQPFTKPYVWSTVALLLLPVALLPLGRPWAFATLACAPLSVTFFSSYVSQQILRGHYSATVLPGVFAAAVYGYARRRRAGPALVTCALLGNFLLGEPAFDRYYETAFGYRPLKHLTLLSIPRQLPPGVLRWHYDVASELARLVPLRCSVMAQNSLGYLFTHRDRLYEVQLGRDADVYVFDRASCRSHTAPGVWRQALAAARSIDGHEPLLRSGGFEAYVRRGLGDEIVAAAQQALSRRPRSAALGYLVGAMSFARGDLETADARLSQIVASGQVDAGRVEVLWLLAEVYARSGRVPRAIETLELGLTLEPANAAARAALAKLRGRALDTRRPR